MTDDYIIQEFYENGVMVNRIIIDTRKQEEKDLGTAVAQAITDLETIQASGATSVADKRIAQIVEGIIKFLRVKFLQVRT